MFLLDSQHWKSSYLEVILCHIPMLLKSYIILRFMCHLSYWTMRLKDLSEFNRHSACCEMMPSSHSRRREIKTCQQKEAFWTIVSTSVTVNLSRYFHHVWISFLLLGSDDNNGIEIFYRKYSFAKYHVYQNHRKYFQFFCLFDVHVVKLISLCNLSERNI